MSDEENRAWVLQKKEKEITKNQIKYKTIKNQIKRIKLTSDLCIVCSTKKIKKRTKRRLSKWHVHCPLYISKPIPIKQAWPT